MGVDKHGSKQEDQQSGRIAEARYRVLIDHAPEAVVILDMESGHFIDYNTNATSLLKLSPEELCQKGPVDISPVVIEGRQSAAYAHHYLLEALRGGNPVFDWIHLDSQGREIPCEVRLIRFPPYDRQLVRASIIDLRDQRRQAQQLRYQASLLDTVQDAIIATDPEFRIQYWNKAAETLYGWKAEEVAGRHFDRIVALDNLQQERAIALDTFRREGYWNGEVMHQRKDGEQRYIQSSVTQLSTPDGEVIGVVAINRDITEQKLAQLALIESEEKFSRAFHDSPTAMLLADLSSLTILDVNQAYTDTLGYAAEEVIGHTGKLGFSLEFSMDWQQQVASLLQEKEKGRLYDHEVTGWRKNGQPINGLISANPVMIGGRLLHFISYVDITERKQALQALEKAKAELSEVNDRLQLSTQAARIGIWDLDILADRLIWDETLCGLYGTTIEEFPQTPLYWNNCLHPDDRNAVLARLLLALQQANTYEDNFRIIWSDDSIHHIRAAAAIHRDAAGIATRMVGVNWDVTQEKEAEHQRLRAQRLESENKELEQFAYIASHDLQEPLRTVLGFVELLKRSGALHEDEKAQRHLQFITEATQRMSDLIRALLDYARIGHKRQLVEVDCEQIVRQVKADLELQITEAGASLTIMALPRIRACAAELRLLFQNLISNAIKFRRPGVAPLIEISATQQSDAWKFRVKDNGIGIPEAFQERVFALFQRLHPRSTYQGSGIGLAHCQKIIGLHGGKIWLDSVEGQGSSFYFTISV
ncbi:MAG: PAS domain S-box protein [Lewinella sp.]|nr:PAS domain S-box protein [Lewinella sp.]